MFNKYTSLFLAAPPPSCSRPMDLSAIKKNIESGVIRTTAEFQRDIMLMFQNAVMYNSSDHDVYHMALEMQRDVLEHVQQFLATQLIMQTSESAISAKSLRGREGNRKPGEPAEKVGWATCWGPTKVCQSAKQVWFWLKTLFKPPNPKMSLLMFETQLWNVLSDDLSTVSQEDILGYAPGATEIMETIFEALMHPWSTYSPLHFFLWEKTSSQDCLLNTLLFHNSFLTPCIQ